MFKQPVFAVICIFLVVKIVSGCTSGFIELDVLRKRAEKIPDGARSSKKLSAEFRLMPGMKFTCDGNMTGVLLGAIVRKENHRVNYPEIQLWRSFDNDTTIFTRMYSEEIRLAAGDFSPDGMLQYNLTTPIQFHSGDVLGIKQPPKWTSVVLLYFTEYNNAPVIYQNLTKETSLKEVNLLSLTSIEDEHVLISPLVTRSSCASGFLTGTELRHLILEVNINDVRPRLRQQRVFPDIQFLCNGNLTKWIVGTGKTIEGNGQNTSYSELQIWRKVDFDDEQRYTKVAYSSIKIDGDKMSSNVYEYTPETPLQFKEGDILGFYQPNSTECLVYYQEDDGPVNYREDLNYASSTFTLGLPYSQYDYPLVTVEIETSASVVTQSTFVNAPVIITSSVAATTSAQENPAVPIAAGVLSVVLFLIIITTVTIVAMIIVISKKRSHKFTYTVQYPAVEYDVNLMTEYHINTRNGTKAYTPAPPCSVQLKGNVAYSNPLGILYAKRSSSNSLLDSDVPRLAVESVAHTYEDIPEQSTVYVQSTDSEAMVYNVTYGVAPINVAAHEKSLTD